MYRDRDRPLALQRLRRCAELAPELFEVDGGGVVSLRVGTTDDPAAYDAAAACPMGAISVVEERAA